MIGDNISSRSSNTNSNSSNSISSIYHSNNGNDYCYDNDNKSINFST